MRNSLLPGDFRNAFALTIQVVNQLPLDFDIRAYTDKVFRIYGGKEEQGPSAAAGRSWTRSSTGSGKGFSWIT